ncbi:CPBP family intramembrane glutamic endopeptidase [Paenibacillus sp. BAC0078]
MEKLKTYAFGRPVMFSIILIVVSVAFTFIPLDPLLVSLLGQQSSEYATGIIEQVLVSFALIWVLKRWGLLKSAGFTRPNWKGLWIYWPIVMYTLLNGADFIFGNIVINTSRPVIIVLFILTYLSTGLFEEVLCRGAVLSVMLRKWGATRRGCYAAVIISSVLFGSAHIIHYFLHHSSLLATLTQMTYGIFIGVFFAACMIRNKSIFPAMLAHGVFDIFGSLQEHKTYLTMTVSNSVISILIFLPLFIYGLVILRKATPSADHGSNG